MIKKTISEAVTYKIILLTYCTEKIWNVIISSKDMGWKKIRSKIQELVSIKNLYPDHPLVISLRNLSYQLSQQNIEIKFLYAPSHVGISGNKVVDTLAKNATIPSPLLTLISDDVKSFFKSLTHQKWQSKWSLQFQASKLFRHKKSVLP